jgi:hypothetical protein
MVKAFQKPKKPDDLAAPANVDWGPAIVNGLTYQQRYDRGLISPMPAAQTEGGIVTAEALKKPDNCLLDRLLAGGYLRRGEERDSEQARRRHEAGMWLREFYFEKALMGERSSGHYGEGRGGGGFEFSDTIPESVAWNRKVIDDVLIEVPGHLGRILFQVCIHEERPKSFPDLRRALDALADHRGM